MILSTLGEVDAAYAFAEGYILHRGPFTGGSSTAEIGKGFGNAENWRHTQWLFTPSTAALRADRRFPLLAKDMGLLDYWNARNVAPDSIHGLSKATLGL